MSFQTLTDLEPAQHSISMSSLAWMCLASVTSSSNEMADGPYLLADIGPHGMGGPIISPLRHQCQTAFIAFKQNRSIGFANKRSDGFDAISKYPFR